MLTSAAYMLILETTTVTVATFYTDDLATILAGLPHRTAADVDRFVAATSGSSARALC